MTSEPPSVDGLPPGLNVGDCSGLTPGESAARPKLSTTRSTDSVSIGGPPPGLASVSAMTKFHSNSSSSNIDEEFASKFHANPQSTAIEEQPMPLASLASEHRKLRRQQRSGKPQKTAGYFVSSPGAFSSEDRDASKHQGKFDMGTVYQAQLRTDRHCMVVDLANGRVLFSNNLCESLFENMAPLQQRDVADFIHEDDRVNFSACLMYLSIGKFAHMDPQEMRILTSKGVQVATLTGEQLEGYWWWLDIALRSEDESGTGSTEKSGLAGDGSPCDGGSSVHGNGAGMATQPGQPPTGPYFL